MTLGEKLSYVESRNLINPRRETREQPRQLFYLKICLLDYLSISLPKLRSRRDYTLARQFVTGRPSVSNFAGRSASSKLHIVRMSGEATIHYNGCMFYILTSCGGYDTYMFLLSVEIRFWSICDHTRMLS